MKKPTQFIVDHPKLIIILNVLITIFLGYYALQLQVDDDIINYLPENEPEVETINHIGDVFNGNNIGVVVVEAENIFDNNVFQHISFLTDQFKNTNGVASVTSLTNVMDMRSDDGELVVGEIVEKDKTYDSEEMNELKDYVLANELYVGNIISENCKYSMILVTLDPEADGKEVVTNLRDVLKQNEAGFKHYLSGAPFMSDDADRSAKNDLKKFVPASILVILLVLFVTFKKLRGTLLPLFAVLIAVIWTMGLMVLMGYDLSTVGIAIPVVLIATGSAYGIHVMNAYYASVTDDKTKKEKLGNAIDQLTIPLFLSSMTTIVGFASLTTSDLSPIRQFGAFTAFGVLAAYITAATFIPALLLVLPAKREKKSVVSKANILQKWENYLLPRSKSVIALMVVLVLGSFLVIKKNLVYDTDFAGAFRSNDPARIAMELVNDEFGGVNIYQILFTGDMKSPFVLNQMNKLEDALKDMNLNGTLAFSDMIKEANDKINGAKAVPKTRDQVASLSLFLEGQEQISNVLKSDYSEALITARYTETSSRKTGKINEQIRELISNLETEAYAVSRLTEDDNLCELANSTLQAELTNELARLLKADDVNAIETIVQELMNYSLAAYAEENEELQDIITDSLDPDYLGFNLERPTESVKAVLASLRQGGNVENFIEVLAEINPNNDVFDIEDAAYSVWDEITMDYLYTREDKVDQLAETLSASYNANAKEVNNILSNAFVSEVYLSTLPEEYQDHPDVRKDTFKVELSGAPVIYEVVTQRLQSSQSKSLAISIVLVCLLLILQVRSITEGLIICVPIVLTVIFNFAFMALTGIPLDVATTMIASVAIGTGVDYSIHFASRFKENYVNDISLTETIIETIGSIGVPVLANAFAVALGMLVLVLSNTVTVAYFGALMALSMVISALLALVLLPSLFLVTKKENRTCKKGDFTNAKSEN